MADFGQFGGRVAQAFGEDAYETEEQFDGERYLFAQDLVEVAAGDAEQLAVFEHGCGRRAGAGVDERHFAEVRALAEERGIQLPERMMGGGRGGNGSRGTRGAATTIAGTVYRLVESTPVPKVEAVPVRLGITNGSVTEVVEGLNEDDVLVTSITIPGAPISPSSSQMNNPFQQQRGFSGRRGG